MSFAWILFEWKSFLHLQIISHQLQVKWHLLLIFMNIFIHRWGFLIKLLKLPLFFPWLSNSLSKVHSFNVKFLLFSHEIDCHHLKIKLFFIEDNLLKIFIFELNMNWILMIYFYFFRLNFQSFLKINLENWFLFILFYRLRDILKKLNGLIENFKISFFMEFIHIPLDFDHKGHFNIKVYFSIFSPKSNMTILPDCK